MSENDLFGAADAPESMTRPLAVRMRPRTLDEVIGQTQVLGQGSPLRRLANPASKGSLTAPSSVILFGPPGVGKTTLATIVAGQSGRVFEELSAVTSGVKDVRDVLTRAHERLVSRGQETVLFIDEVHRFSKSQQDALLPAVENRDVTFIGATTENPSFSIIKPLLSRSVVVKLESLEPDQLIELVQRALTDDRGLRGEVKATDEAIADIVRMAGGDARKSLTILEAAAGAVTGDEARKKGARRPIITPEIVATVMDTATVRYDKDGDDHYDVISAFIKPMGGSDPDAAIHYLARMLKAGEDPRFIARRIMIAASEEVGMAAPQILQVTVAAAQAVALVGMPEACIILAEATYGRPGHHTTQGRRNNRHLGRAAGGLAHQRQRNVVDELGKSAVFEERPHQAYERVGQPRGLQICARLARCRGATGIYARRAAWHRVLPSQRSRL